MTWVRILSKRIFANRLPHVPVEKAQKYMSAVRIIYFFSASSLLIIALKNYKDANKNTVLESGKPTIQDLTPAHKNAREKGYKTAILYDYKPDQGMVKYEYHRDEYLQQLEKEALERAKEAQRKALAEGRELPPDAIRLV